MKVVVFHIQHMSAENFYVVTRLVLFSYYQNHIFRYIDKYVFYVWADGWEAIKNYVINTQRHISLWFIYDAVISLTIITKCPSMGTWYQVIWHNRLSHRITYGTDNWERDRMRWNCNCQRMCQSTRVYHRVIWQNKTGYENGISMYVHRLYCFDFIPKMFTFHCN